VSLLNVGTYTTPNSYFPKAMSVSSELLSGKTLFSYQLITLSRMLQTDASSTLKDSLISSFLQKCPYNEYNSVITNNYKKNIEASKKNIPNNILESKFETVEGKEKTFKIGIAHVCIPVTCKIRTLSTATNKTNETKHKDEFHST